MTTDESVVDRIGRLVDEERRLRSAGQGLEPEDRQRIERLEVELDQCWDLLRQRRAREEFGEDPETAHVRDPDTVEGYRQ